MYYTTCLQDHFSTMSSHISHITQPCPHTSHTSHNHVLTHLTHLTHHTTMSSHISHITQPCPHTSHTSHNHVLTHHCTLSSSNPPLTSISFQWHARWMHTHATALGWYSRHMVVMSKLNTRGGEGRGGGEE